MAKIDTLLKEMYSFCYGIFCGNDKVSSIFSFDGTLSRSLGWATAIVLHLILQMISWIDIKLITYIFALVGFYCILALVQKRCRDFGRAGTFWIVFISLLMVMEHLIYFLNFENMEMLYLRLQKTENFLYCLLIIPLLIPSKPKPDLELRSPLLKYPLLYVALCWVLAISATWIVSRYTQTGFTFF